MSSRAEQSQSGLPWSVTPGHILNARRKRRNKQQTHSTVEHDGPGGVLHHHDLAQQTGDFQQMGDVEAILSLRRRVVNAADVPVSSRSNRYERGVWLAEDHRCEASHKVPVLRLVLHYSDNLAWRHTPRRRKSAQGFRSNRREVLRTGGCGGQQQQLSWRPSQLLRRSTLCGAASFLAAWLGASPISSAVIMLVTNSFGP